MSKNDYPALKLLERGIFCVVIFLPLGGKFLWFLEWPRQGAEGIQERGESQSFVEYASIEDINDYIDNEGAEKYFQQRGLFTIETDTEDAILDGIKQSEVDESNPIR